MRMEGYSLSDIAAATGNNGNNNGFGNGDGAWLIILFLIFAMGFGRNGNGGFFGGNGGSGYPTPLYINNSDTNSYGGGNACQRGFDQLAITSGITNLGNAITTGFNNQAVSQCNQTTELLGAINNDKFDTVMAITNTGYALNNTMMANEMARQQCCCDTKQSIADLKATIISENCADRQALNEGVRDILANQTASVQRILDQMCSDKIDSKNEKIAELQRELSMKDLQASQIAQNSFIAQGFANEVDQLYNRLNSCPVPTTPVYGRTPIFTCNGGCGCNGGYNGFIQ